jgi:hypothetical protein
MAPKWEWDPRLPPEPIALGAFLVELAVFLVLIVALLVATLLVGGALDALP